MATRRLWDIDRDHIQLSEDRIFYTWSGGNASSDNIRSMVRNLSEFVELHDRPIGYVLHLARSARPPSAEDRARATKAFNACGPKLAGVALVVDASGFAGALLRGAVNTVFFIQRQGFTPRVFENIETAAEWLGHTTHSVPAHIIELAQHAREQLALRAGNA